jgi:hypothetical protein
MRRVSRRPHELTAPLPRTSASSNSAAQLFGGLQGQLDPGARAGCSGAPALTCTPIPDRTRLALLAAT